MRLQGIYLQIYITEMHISANLAHFNIFFELSITKLDFIEQSIVLVLIQNNVLALKSAVSLSHLLHIYIYLFVSFWLS